MAEMDTSSGGGHKKGPGVKKRKKVIDPRGSHPHGGPRVPADHFFHFYHDC